MTRPGVYRHFKGGLYRALFVAADSTNGRGRAPVVVYVSLSTGSVDVRDEAEFHDVVKHDVEERDMVVEVPRFAWEGP